jgi:hypothetical protein
MLIAEQWRGNTCTAGMSDPENAPADRRQIEKTFLASPIDRQVTDSEGCAGWRDSGG